jgi:hypothetical protein
MRWDPLARGGAGGWVEVPGGSSAPPHTPWQGPGPVSAPDGSAAPPPSPPLPPLPLSPPLPSAFPSSPPGPPGPATTDGPRVPRRRAALIAGAVVLAVAVAALVIGRQVSEKDQAGHHAGGAHGTASSPGASSLVSSPESSTSYSGGSSAAGSGAEQAAAVDALLDSSAADRQKVVDAVRSIAACESVADAGTALETAAANRDALVSRLDSLTVDLVDGGREAVAELRTAWQHSAEADRAFAQWASSAEGCTTAADVKQNGAYDSGVSHSEQATAAKKAFIRQWDLIAGQYGLSPRDETGI